MSYKGTPEEVRRKERDKKRRQRVLARLEREGKLSPKDATLPLVPPATGSSSVLSMDISIWEIFRAGVLAGMLKCAFRLPQVLVLADEEDMREWLRTHPVGSSFVTEELMADGLLESLKRWRG